METEKIRDDRTTLLAMLIPPTPQKVMMLMPWILSAMDSNDSTSTVSLNTCDKKHKFENDTLYNIIRKTLSKDTFMTVADIYAIIGNDTITSSKISSHLIQLARAGIVVRKENVIVETEDGKHHKMNCYKLA